MKLTNPIRTVLNFMKLAVSQYTPIDLMGNELNNIFNFYQLSESIGTAGQPTALQFQAVQEAGYSIVINLAPGTHENALPQENNVIEALNMTYVHIPVAFDQPTAADFDRFCQVLQEHPGQSVFVHCAANLRVSSFMYLYRRIYQGISPEQAQIDLAKLWVPNPIWQEFIDRTIAERLPS
jgi:protein tyrosine phosphatase (PTP) superfamily phosphohydrolase (DUF442 family)